MSHGKGEDEKPSRIVHGHSPLDKMENCAIVPGGIPDGHLLIGEKKVEAFIGTVAACSVAYGLGLLPGFMVIDLVQKNGIVGVMTSGLKTDGIGGDFPKDGAAVIPGGDYGGQFLPAGPSRVQAYVKTLVAIQELYGIALASAWSAVEFEDKGSEFSPENN